ncbi:hypothetical protein [Streptomyces microflavus]|uniref:hypothetical protein n=1 Tax=Streptomyces microflavus TaxID=1919 RepID=UPI003B20F3AA
MTATEFRQTHGDPTTWTSADIEAQQNLAACDALPEATRMWLHMPTLQHCGRGEPRRPPRRSPAA